MTISPLCIWRNWGLEKLYDCLQATPTGQSQQRNGNWSSFTPKPPPLIISTSCPFEPVPTGMFQLLTLVSKMFVFNRWYTLLQMKIFQHLHSIFKNELFVVVFICANRPCKSPFFVLLQLWFYLYFKSRSFFLWSPPRLLLGHPYIAVEAKNGKSRVLNWTLAL